MTKTILSLVGLLAVGVVAYTFATGKKPDFVVEAEKNAVKAPAAQTQPPAAQPAPAPAPAPVQAQQPAPAPQTPAPEPAPAPAEKKNDPNDPLTWDMTMIRKNPEKYFNAALGVAQKNFDEMRAKEAELRVKQRTTQRNVEKKEAEARALKQKLEDAKKAIAEANAKYKDHPEKWVVDFPYKGARTTRDRMAHMGKQLLKRAELAQLVADKTNGVNTLLQNAIKVVSQKALNLEMTVETLEANYKIVQTEGDVAAINLNEEEIAKCLDMSEVYMEMDGMDKMLKTIAEGSAADAADEPLLNELGL